MRQKVKANVMLTTAFFQRLSEALFHPFRGLPVPDFNNKYDETIL